MLRSASISVIFCFVFAVVLAAPVSLHGTDSWKRYSPVKGLSLELPGKPMDVDVPVSETTREYIQTMQNQAITAEGLYVLVSFVEYTPAAVVDLQSAADGSINGVKGNPGVSDFKVVSRTNCTKSGKEAVKMICTYKSGGTTQIYESLQVAQGRKLWQVVAGYVPGTTGQSDSARVFKSVNFAP